MLAAQPLSSFAKGPRTASFSLIEMLVACAILAIILGVVFQLTNQVSTIWRSSTSRIQAFQEAREGFEAMTRRLSQATLNTYYDYYNSSQQTRTAYYLANPNGTFVPSTYDRVSDLHFISGQARTLLAASPTAVTTQTHAVFFQSPIGYSTSYLALDNALNACGYFLQFDDAKLSIPTYVTSAPTYKPRYRFRLMEMLQPTESLGVYYGTHNYDWFVNNAVDTASNMNSRISAENVIALVLLPELPVSADTSGPPGTNLAPYYNYDSRIPLGAASDTAWSSASPAFPADSFTTQTNGVALPAMTRHNQLPPLMHVVMIVIDEASAMRLQGGSTTVPAAINLASITPALFTSASNLNTDIQSVQDICNAKSGNLTGNTLPLNYRIFYSDVIMRDAKWSND